MRFTLKPRDLDNTDIVKAVASIVPAAILLLVVIAFVISTIVEYAPFVVRSVSVTPQQVCTRDTVTVHIDRKFTDRIERLELTESWVTVSVSGLGTGLPVKTSTGTLSQDKLTAPQDSGFVRVESPLLQEAPPLPGVYRVEITTEVFGAQWGVLPVDGTATYQSSPVRVISCDGRGVQE